jgi:hypothetical protein
MKLPTAELLSADETHSMYQDRVADSKSLGPAYFRRVKQATLTAKIIANDTIQFLIPKIPSETRHYSLLHNV